MTHQQLRTKVEALEALIQSGVDVENAETQARKLLVHPLTIESPELHSRVLLVLVESLLLRGLVQEALPFAEQARIRAEQGQSQDLEAKALGIIALLYQDLADFTRALECFGRALVINEELGNKDGAASNTGNIGVVYWYRSDYTKALEYCNRALAMNEELGNRQGVANNFSNMGLVYDDFSDYPKALEYYQRALAINEELGNKRYVARNMGNMGVVYLNLADYPKALEFMNRALAFSEENSDLAGVASWTGNIGNVYLHLSDYTKALESFSRSLPIHEKLSIKAGVAHDAYNIGTVYSKKVFAGYSPAKSEEYLLRAIAICTEIGAKTLLVEGHKSLADLYEQEERLADAFLYLKKYIELKDEINIEDTKKQEAIRQQQKEIELAKAAANARHLATQELLHNVLPPSIAQRIIEGEKLIAEKLSSVSVLFADIVNFTKLSQRITAEELVEGLDRIFSSFDTLAEKHGLEKIKTIGDAYMVVSGAPEARADHAEAMAQFALEMVEAMKDFTSKTTGEQIQLRVGIHSGDVVAGVIGKKKFAYDLWGDTVNTASRMESHGEAGKIHTSEEFASLLGSRQQMTQTDIEYILVDRGEVKIKGKDLMRTYYLEKA